MLVEIILKALLNIDDLQPVSQKPLQELPANLMTYFENSLEKKSCG